ncbi:hypothetical protein ACJX0J_017082 [Zea mays]
MDGLIKIAVGKQKKTEVNDKIKCIALDQYLEGQYQRAQNIGNDMPKSSIIIGQANNTQADLKLHPQGLGDLLSSITQFKIIFHPQIIQIMNHIFILQLLWYKQYISVVSLTLKCIGRNIFGVAYNQNLLVHMFSIIPSTF